MAEQRVPPSFASAYADFVAHPRFGVGPRITGSNPEATPDARVYLHWHSPADQRVPGTAVSADLSRQSPATLAVTHYFDVVRQCRSCGRKFLFFAEEQKHWYEELKFPLEADCLRCPACRRAEHQLRATRDRYVHLLQAANRSPELDLEFAECGAALIEAGVFTPKLLPKLRSALKRAASSAQAETAARAEALLRGLTHDRQ